MNSESAPRNHKEYAETQKQQLKDVYELASICSQNSAIRGKNHYGQKVYGAALWPGDRSTCQEGDQAN